MNGALRRGVELPYASTGGCKSREAEPDGRERAVDVGGVRPHQVRAVSWSRASRYGARYFAAILLGGDQVDSSVISELNPCPPVICAVRYRGLLSVSSMPRITG